MSQVRRRGQARILGWAAVAVLVSAACQSSSANDEEAGENGPWLTPSPVLEQQIQDEVERLPWTHGLERVELIRWFTAVGEPAYDALLQLAADPRDDVAAAALAALGATGDRRLVESVHELPWDPAERGTDLNLERSRALVRLGDWNALPDLIRGLRDERSYTRSLCFQTLRDITRQHFDYDPRGNAESREAAVRRWEDWWLARRNDENLATPGT